MIFNLIGMLVSASKPNRAFFVKSCICIILITKSLLSSVQAEEGWTEFRGPNGTGHAENSHPPVNWSETENVAWKTEIPGRGWSSPVVFDGQIWLTTATPDGLEMFAVAVDADSGKVIHNVQLFTNETPNEIHVTNSYASSSPIIEGEYVYIHFGAYGTACLERDSAKVVWTRRDLPCHHWRGPGSSPIIFENLLIVHYDGFDYQYVVALNKLTGETVWKQDRKDLFETDNGDHKKAYGTPAIFEVDGQPLLISPYAKATMAYRPRTGEEVWWVRYDQHSTANRPLYDGKRIYIGTGFGKGSIIAIDPKNASGDITETNVVWEYGRSMPSKPSQLLIEGRIYTIADKIGVATCLNAETGEMIWQERIGGTFSASPVYSGGHIYFCDEDGKTTLISPGETFEIVAENQLEAGCMATPAPVANSLFLRTKTHLYRLANK